MLRFGETGFVAHRWRIVVQAIPRLQTQATRLKRYLLTPEGAIFAAILLGVTLIRLPLMTFHGYYSDLATYIGWGNIVNQHFTDIYTTTAGRTFGGNGGTPGGFGGGGNGGFPGGGFGSNRGFGGGGGIFSGYINYPPGTPYLFGALVFIYNHFLVNFWHSSLDALVGQDGIGPFLAKIPLLIADIAAIALLYWQARKRHSQRFALLVAVSYGISPAVLYNGTAWGQTDGFVALPVLIALFAIVSDRFAIAGVSLAIAVMIKPQPVIFVPLVLLYLWRWARREQFIAFTVAGAATVLVFLLPILVPHFQLFNMIGNMQTESYNDSLSLSSDAFNFWWLVGLGQASIGTTILGVKAGLIGDVLFGAVTVLCGIQIWRHREPIYLFFGSAVQLFGFFMFMGGQHERYLFLFIPLALASLIMVRREQSGHLIVLYVLGTALCFLNMLVGVGGGSASGFANSQLLPLLNLSGLGTYISTNFDSLSGTIAFLQLAAFLYAAYVYLTGSFASVERVKLHSASGVALPPAVQLRPLEVVP